MKAVDIRKCFLDYFGSRGHTVVPSASLVPPNDPTLFFTNAGMVPFKDVFVGEENRDYVRATSIQKCMRVSGKHNDLENVGRTPRHHTFFEMLGNFSFGDYFKAEAIPMAWELLTGDFGIDPERLWVTVFEHDDEAYDLWRSIDFPAARIQRLGAKDNYWSMGPTGPCGPCTEIHYDHGAHLDPRGGGPATESDRYVEIWNLVFMQSDQIDANTRVPLPRPSIDTGAGLERVAAVTQGVYSNYDTDLFAGLLARGSQVAGVTYGADVKTDTALRVLADHARATAFLIADGVMPSNEARGYVLRRVMRRAIRFGVTLGVERPFLYELTDQVVRDFADAYPELGDRAAFMEEVVRSEEERFRRTLDRGMSLLNDAIDTAGDGGTITGERAFELSDTFGFPLDLTQLIASERGVTVDQVGYADAMDAQKARGRAAWKGSGEEAIAGLWRDLASTHGVTDFTGYTHNEDAGEVVALFQDRDDDLVQVNALAEGESGIVLLDRTPFYGESGGQTGDAGELSAQGVAFTVTDTGKAEGLHLHRGVITEGTLAVGASVRASVNADQRDATRRNHTATHLLHAALRRHLGDHVTQKGSLVGPNRLRFDFSHHKALTSDDLRAIEDTVNQSILANTPTTTTVMNVDAARAAGAMALFGEKYGDEVRVVAIGDTSVELCGGTHAAATGDIGQLRIQQETGIAAGVRRIEAQTGTGALTLAREHAAQLSAAATALKTSPDRLVDGITRLQDERRGLQRELASLQRELAKAAAGDLLSSAVDVGPVKVLAARFDGDLKEQADRLRDQLGSAVVVLATAADGKVRLIAAVTSDLAGKTIHAGKLIGAIAPHVGGRGGGRPDMAQAGGKDEAGIDAALAAAVAWVQAALA